MTRSVLVLAAAAACSGHRAPAREPIDPHDIVKQVCTRSGVGPILRAPAAAPAQVTFAAGGQLVALDDAGFHPIAPDLRGVFALALDATGLWAVAPDGIHRVGDDHVTFPAGDQRRMPDRIAIAPDHTAWGMTSDAVFHATSAGWDQTPREAIGGSMLESIAVDGGGQVWVLRDDGLSVRTTGGAWQRVEPCKSGGPTLLFHDLALGADGLYFTAENKVYRLTDHDLTALSYTRYLEDATALAVAPDGKVAVATHDDLYAIDPAKPAVRDLPLEQVGLAYAAELAVDAHDRIWAAGDGGVAIVDGEHVTTWPRATQPALAGGPTAIAIAGPGPSTLPKAGPVLRGTVTGVVRVNGYPTAGIKVEICPGPGMVFQSSPCEGQDPRMSVETDDRGTFTFKDLPLGVYDIAMDHGGWSITSLGKVRGMTAGGTVDLGPFDYD